MKYGQRVRIVNIEGNPQFDGAIGTVLGSLEDGRTRVMLRDGGGVLGVREDQMVEITPSMCQHCGYPVPR